MAITSTTALTGLVATAYDMAIEFAFQPQLAFAQFAQEKRWDLDTAPVPGSTIRFTIYGELTAADSALSETADPGANTVTKTGKDVTMVEYGKLITTTNKLRVTSFADIDVDVATLVGNNMGKSVDLIARAAFQGQTASTYLMYPSGAVNLTGIFANSNFYLQASHVRYAFNRLERNDVPPIDGIYYAAVVHADPAYDLRSETGSGSWRTPKEYVDPENIYNGEIGEFEGFRFVVSSHASILEDGGSAAVDLYYNYFIGFQALAYAEGVPPAMGTSGPFDALQRLNNIYWYGLLGFGELRPEALFKIYSAASLGENT